MNQAHNAAKSLCFALQRLNSPSFRFPGGIILSRAVCARLLKEGVELSVTPLDTDEQRIVETAVAANGGRGNFRPRDCWVNSQVLALDPHFDYWEGFVFRSDGGSAFPIPHAWNMVNGKVVDLTLEAQNQQSGTETAYDYFGLAHERQRVQEHVLRHHSLILEWESLQESAA